MKRARIAKLMTLKELSKKTGISFVRLCDLERHRAEPTSHEVDQIALVLGNKIRFAGQDEAIQNNKKFAEQTAAINKIYKHIQSLGLKKGNGGSGTMHCPICNNNLIFRVNEFNGHIWAICKTDGCLNFMQ